MTNTALTQEDIDLLSKSLSLKTKKATIKKIGHYYNDVSLSFDEKKIAEDIFRSLVNDSDIKVRIALVDIIKSSKNVPRDIIEAVINDEDKTAIPFIKNSKSLTFDDLKTIVSSYNIEKQIAAAQRKQLPSEVCEYIADNCSEEVVDALLENEEAEISKETYNIIAEKYSKSEKIKNKLLERRNLPVSIIEKIIKSLTEVLQKELAVNKEISEYLVSDMVEEIKDKLSLRISKEYDSDDQIDALVVELYKINRLTPTLVGRSICMGDLKFFEYSLHYLTGRSILNIRSILSNTKDEFMIRNVMREANIPNNFFSAVIAALKIIYEMDFDLKSESRESFTQKVIERVLTYDSINEKMDLSDIEYLVSKI